MTLIRYVRWGLGPRALQVGRGPEHGLGSIFLAHFYHECKQWAHASLSMRAWVAGLVFFFLNYFYNIIIINMLQYI